MVNFFDLGIKQKLWSCILCTFGDSTYKNVPSHFNTSTHHPQSWLERHGARVGRSARTTPRVTARGAGGHHDQPGQGSHRAGAHRLPTQHSHHLQQDEVQQIVFSKPSQDWFWLQFRPSRKTESEFRSDKLLIRGLIYYFFFIFDDQNSRWN